MSKLTRNQFDVLSALATRGAMTENCYIAEYGQGGEGDNSYQEVGISYWNAEDGRKPRDGIKTALGMPGGRQKYW